MAEIYVTSTADSGAGSLRKAIADAQDGDVILFDAAIFSAGQTTTIYLSSYLQIDKSVSIYGGFNDGNGGYTSGAEKQYYVYREIDDVKTKVVIASPNDAQEGETLLFENVCRVALDGQGTGRCAMTTARSADAIVISGLCLQNGYVNGPAAGFYAINDAPVVLTDCTIKDSIATSNGSGIFFSNTNGNTLSGCSIVNCNAETGAGYYASNAAVNIINDCCFDSCSSTSYGGAILASNNAQQVFNNCTIYGCSASGGGGVYARGTSKNTLNDCIFDGCSATANGGAIQTANTSQNNLTDCVISGCTATSNGGGVFSSSNSQNALTNCVFESCTATSGGAIRTGASSAANIVNCKFKNSSVYFADTSSAVVSASKSDALTTGPNSAVCFASGVSTVAAATINAATITIADGAALSITTSATIGAATFTSSGRGYLAVGAGIDTSAATLTNVVLCAYGADVSSFAEVDGVLEWSAANPTTTVLIERADGDSWSTVAQPTGESLTLYLPPSDTVRLFDGVQFFVATAPSQRTYYYIGGSEGSFTSAADWSLRRGGVAITEPPVVAGQRFIVGDIAEGEQGS